MIEARGITKSLGGAKVLSDLSVTIAKHRITSIIGPNGAGKSTLLGVISRLLGMDAGQVSIDGLDIARTPTDQLARKLSILRQDNHMTARLTVHDLVSFGRYPYSKGRLTGTDHDKIDQSLRYLGLSELSDRFLDELSGGQRQRAFAAMVLCQDTDYVLLDEPLNNLDMKHAQSMMKTLRRMCVELNKTAVIVLHDINFASWYSDHIIAMKDGTISASGPTEAIITEDRLEQIYEMPFEIIETRGRRTVLYYE